jgi:CarD family transcriptional regulator
MELSVGQKVAYPNQGVCLVEDIERKKIGENLMKFYALRVLSDNSIIFVPTANAATVGIRPIITMRQYRRLVDELAADFEAVSSDWKMRSREFNDKLQSGDVFEAADVLKKLTFLSHAKKLSLREQTFLEKARYMIVAEVISAGLAKEDRIENKINQLVENACRKHLIVQPSVMAETH